MLVRQARKVVRPFTLQKLWKSTSIAVSEDFEPIEEVDDFKKYGVNKEIARNLRNNSITQFFEVQKRVLDVSPLSSEDSKDLIVRSSTGSGKTLAFGLPFAHKVLAERRTRSVGKPTGLVLAPTRELARQVEVELSKYTKGLLNGVVIYGGVPYESQLAKIFSKANPVDYIVGTPGRVKDLVHGGKLDLSYVKSVVLDEADEMLRQNFKEELDEILENMPEKEDRLNLLFSATFGDSVRRLAQEYLRSGEEVENINLLTSKDSKIPDTIEMKYIVVGMRARLNVLGRVLASLNRDNKKAIVFANTKAACEEICGSDELASFGVSANSLHGDISQGLREKTLRSFREGEANCLVATDVAARGLDIPNVNMVIHYLLPDKLESFVHRSGRTGRAGNSGENMVIMSGHIDDITQLKHFEKQTGRTFAQVTAPTKLSLALTQLPQIVDQIKVSRAKHVDKEFMQYAVELVEECSSKDDNLNKEEVVTLVSKLLMSSCGVGEEESSVSYINGNEGLTSIYISSLPFNKIKNAESLVKVANSARTDTDEGVVIDVADWFAENSLDILKRSGLECELVTDLETPPVLRRSVSKWSGSKKSSQKYGRGRNQRYQSKGKYSSNGNKYRGRNKRWER
eukprot:maker-scaffold_18-snap-gene-6.0-mRNA-1 protein AED:0.01 eAED:0.01 QI:82/1/1/1/1/1/2/311/626